MMQATKSAPPSRLREAQVLLTVVRCGAGRGLVGLRVLDGSPGAASEHFIPFRAAEADNDHGRELTYAGVIAALDRLRALKLHRISILVDDSTLVNELERKLEPPRELFLQYVILGCKLNEFARANVVVTPAERLEELRAKTATLAATIYRQAAGSRQSDLLPLAPAI